MREVTKVCEGVQIPAFLCRQTDLITEAAKHAQFLNIKKGQFLSPSATHGIVEKARSTNTHLQDTHSIALTERGSMFGYGDLVVDMRSLSIMAASGAKVIFDVTHSTQSPPSTTQQTVSGAQRKFAPLLARCAAASGYISGIFLEVHPTPHKAWSDSSSQLNIDQAQELLRQTIPLIKHAQNLAKTDSNYC